MGKSKKGGKFLRIKSALARLEKQFEDFKKEGKDQEPRDTTRNGGKRVIHHSGIKFADKCKWFEIEISRTKENLSKWAGRQ